MFEKKEFNAHPVIVGVDDTFDEKGSMFLALRKVQWCKNDEEPDESKAKLELRKWMVDQNGKEIANKGFSFLTEEGPHELTKVLVHEGYGHTKDILKELKERDDFKDSVEHLTDAEDTGSGDYFDIRELLDDNEDVEES